MIGLGVVEVPGGRWPTRVPARRHLAHPEPLADLGERQIMAVVQLPDRVADQVPNRRKRAVELLGQGQRLARPLGRVAHRRKSRYECGH